MALPALEPLEPLVAEFGGPQGRGVQIIGYEHLESTVAAGVDQAVCGHLVQLLQTFELGLPGNHPVAEELLDHLAVRAVFRTAADGLEDSAGHGIIGVEVFDGVEVRQFDKVRAHQPLAVGLDDAAVFAVTDSRDLV